MMNRHFKTLMLALGLTMGLTPLSAQQNDYLTCYNVQRAQEVIDEKPAEAYQYLKREVNERPGNGYAWYLLAQCYKSNSNYGTILDYTGRAIQCLANDPAWLAYAHLERANTYGWLEKSSEQLNELNLAVKAASRLKGENAIIDPLIARAQYYVYQKDYDKADADYRLTIKTDPHSAMPYIGLSRNADARGKYAEAIKYVLKAFETDPEYHFYHLYAILPYWHNGEEEKAAEHLIEALYDDGTYTEARELVLDSLLTSDLIVNRLDSACRVHPDKPFAMTTALLAHYRCNHSAKALELGRLLVDQNPESGVAYHFATLAARLAGELDLELEWAEKEFALDSTDVESFTSLAKAYIDLQRYDDTRILLEKAIDLFPDHTDSYFYLARSESYAGRMEEAIAQSRIAYMINPQDNDISEELCHLLFLTGQKSEAHPLAEEILAADTIDAEANINLAILEAHLGKFDAAFDRLDNFCKKYPWAKGDMLVRRAEVQMIKGDIEGARQSLVEAKALGIERFRAYKDIPLYRDHREILENL